MVDLVKTDGGVVLIGTVVASVACVGLVARLNDMFVIPREENRL